MARQAWCPYRASRPHVDRDATSAAHLSGGAVVATAAAIVPDREDQVWAVLEAVPDPEIPVLTVVDLGIVRHVRWLNGSDGQPELHVGITPTYSGCPATEVIRGMIAAAL